MKWFEMWMADKTCMVETMMRNMAADLEAGYNPMGACIRGQQEDIRKYQEQFDKEIDHLKEMTDEKHIERWCYLDLRKRGAIA